MFFFSSFFLKTRTVGKSANIYFWLGPETSQVRKKSHSNVSSINSDQNNNNSSKKLLTKGLNTAIGITQL